MGDRSDGHERGRRGTPGDQDRTAVFRRKPGGGMPEPDKFEKLYGERRSEGRSGGRPEGATRSTRKLPPTDDESRGARSGGSGRRTPGREYGGGSGSNSPRRRREARARRRRIAVTVLVLVLLVPMVFYFWADSRLHGVAALEDYEGRPENNGGTTYMIVGSDSREGLTDDDMNNLRTGNAAGKRTDTIMVLYVPDDGTPTIVSVPRDSYVPIPELGENKINAAFSEELGGGPSRLVQSFEQKSGVRIDHYIEIGFSGFVGIVDAVGGVELCPKTDMKDPKAGLDIKAGCQEMDGPTALGYVRTRAGGRADLDRIKRQREFFGALIEQSTSVGTLINPFRSVPLVLEGTDTFTVDNGDHLNNLMGMALAMRAKPKTTSIPIGSLPTLPNAGSVVIWDETRSAQMFAAMKEGKPIPKSAMQD